MKSNSLTLRHPAPALFIAQEQHYYPFGLPLTGAAVTTQPAESISKRQYNGGSTLEDELTDAESANYATPYRRYDPAIGRLLGVDPLADKYADLSPGNYAFNDPVNFNDPSGADGSPGNGGVNTCLLCPSGAAAYSSGAYTIRMGGDGSGGHGEQGGGPGKGPHGEELVTQNGRVGYFDSRSVIQNGENVVLGSFHALGFAAGSGGGSSGFGLDGVLGTMGGGGGNGDSNRNGATNLLDDASKINTVAIFGMGAMYDTGGRLLNSNTIGAVAPIIAKRMNDNPLRYAQTLRRMSPVLKGIGTKIGYVGTATTVGIFAAKVVTGTANTADYVDVSITGALLFFSQTRFAPIALGLGLGYGAVRLDKGDEIDAAINAKFGFR